ncbi:type IX secretion/gliding motility protein PorT/SprT [Phaeocystidibacter marisrubri]|uniref:PorT family protein n=1 Tax=Phaeocystidibacter marisrubri TaxID=1577780 RepID=A0A6L3ZGG6_9FLAO|nr:porin family protein [Phaeocystidibacter marisrubri]KAB2817122.1 PorT family protein [Phaeocystidibacter marisrubri]GGH76767.1 PorT protein [Phaeocystidibacter marisrubri]
MLKHFKYIFLFLLATSSLISKGQSRNLRLYDQRPIHFGFYVGINMYDFQLRMKEDISQVADFYGVRSEVSPGYSIGIVSDLRLGHHLNFRFLPSFVNTERTLYFDMVNKYSGERLIQERKIESSLVQAPFELKLKSDRIENHRWYVLTGITFSFDLASKEKVEDDLIFKLKSSDLSYDFGVGMDIYFEYFKLSPQIKAFFGVNDLTVQDGTVPVSGLESTRTRGILFCLTFE